ncbi:MAG: alpha/beta hydrolase [Acidobacteriota bacterium]
MAADHKLNIDGIAIRIRRAGAGAPVLILHGWGASTEAMQMIVEEVARGGYEAVAIDFPGHGQSAPPPRAWHVFDFKQFLLRLMDELRIEAPHIIAHSFGCRVTIKLASENPDRVNRLVMTGAAGLPPRRTRGQKARMRLASVGKKVKSALGDGALSRWLESRWVHHVASADYRAASGVMRATLVHIVGEDLTEDLKRIQAPTILIWGSEDHDAPLSSGESMAHLIPAAELVVLEGGGHFAYAEQFSKFRLHMNRFLRGGA